MILHASLLTDLNYAYAGIFGGGTNEAFTLFVSEPQEPARRTPEPEHGPYNKHEMRGHGPGESPADDRNNVTFITY